MPLPFALVPEPAAPRRSAAPLRRRPVSTMFPSSTLACSVALVVYALFWAILPREVHPPVIITPPPEPPMEHVKPEDLEPPAHAAPHVVPPTIEPHPASPVPDVKDPANIVPVPDTVAVPDMPWTAEGVSGGIDEPVGDERSGGGGGEGIVEGPAVYYEEAPVPILEVKPDYPDLARAAGVEGTVVLRVLVGRDGRVKAAEVAESIPLLNGAAVEAARRWTFSPARVSGRPVAVWVAVPMRFKLH